MCELDDAVVRLEEALCKHRVKNVIVCAHADLRFAIDELARLRSGLPVTADGAGHDPTCAVCRGQQLLRDAGAARAAAEAALKKEGEADAMGA